MQYVVFTCYGILIWEYQCRCLKVRSAQSGLKSLINSVRISCWILRRTPPWTTEQYKDAFSSYKIRCPSFPYSSLHSLLEISFISESRWKAAAAAPNICKKGIFLKQHTLYWTWTVTVSYHWRFQLSLLQWWPGVMLRCIIKAEGWMAYECFVVLVLDCGNLSAYLAHTGTIISCIDQ